MRQIVRPISAMLDVASISRPLKRTAASPWLRAIRHSTRPLTQITGWYDGGELTWTGGANTGQTVAVRRWDAGAGILSLFLPALFAVEVGDTFTIRPGCDKSFATCKTKFDNAINFRGFPHVPGNDQILRYPDAQS